MNKDKVIKDLKERNDKLKNQYQIQEIRLHSLEYENKKYKELLDKIKKILEENIDDEFYINLTKKEKSLFKIQELLEEIE